MPWRGETETSPSASRRSSAERIGVLLMPNCSTSFRSERKVPGGKAAGDDPLFQGGVGALLQQPGVDRRFCGGGRCGSLYVQHDYSLSDPVRFVFCDDGLVANAVEDLYP